MDKGRQRYLQLKAAADFVKEFREANPDAPHDGDTNIMIAISYGDEIWIKKEPAEDSKDE